METQPDRAVVTGATGLVGRSLVARLARPSTALSFGADDWRERLARTDLRDATVFHLAARVHRPNDHDDAAYERDNAGKTVALAEAAARAGARRIVFLSSVKVNGEESGARPVRADDAPAPLDAYARSKWAAERELARIAAKSGLAVVIVRAPLVFGAAAAGNLGALLRLADTPWPLPFAALHNRRSFVHVDDLARLLVACAVLPDSAGSTFLAAHRDPFSTARLVTLLREALGRPSRLFAFPPRALEMAAALAGQGAAARRLTRSLEVDSSATERALGWRAEVSIEEAAREIVNAYREAGRP
jgi:nucleoside-diphosphate-sugar epimerase